MEKDSQKEIELLQRDKYGGRKDVNLDEDIVRLSRGEPLAYVIGHIPFLGLSIALDSRPLIPRPETEWWTEVLTSHLEDKGSPPHGAHLRVLDLCAGSGAVGLSVLSMCKNTHVSFGELFEKHGAQIERNIERNTLDASRSVVRTGNLFEPFSGEVFDVIATNPPYIPTERTLPEEVLLYEPPEALFGGIDGLLLIQEILKTAPAHLTPGGELWMECDIDHIDRAKHLAYAAGFSEVEIRTDQYGRPRLLVAYL